MRTVYLALLLFLANQVSAQLQLNYNRGFEVTQGNDDFRYWTTSSDWGHQFQRDASVKHGGRFAQKITGKGIARAAQDVDGAAVYLILPADLLKGKTRIELTGWMRAADTGTRAGLGVLQLTGDALPQARISYLDADSPGKWQKLSARFELGANVENVLIGGMMNGSGTVWLDDFELGIDGVVVSDIARPIAEPTTAEIGFLKQHLVPLAGVQPGADNRDLDALSRWIGDARLIAVGEPTHGSSEPFQFRLRLLQYLVEQKGFNTFMIEDELPEADLMNDYVLHGKDSARKLLLQYFFPVWRSEELLNLIEWMRSYNQAHEQKIQFRGMDMQSGYVALRTLERFAKNYDTSLLFLSRNLNQLNLRFYTEKQNKTRIKDSLIIRTSELDVLVRNLQAGTNIPVDTLENLVRQVNVLTQFYPNISWEKSTIYRDSCMAYNILEYSRLHPEARMLIWAHNSHVSRMTGLTGDWLSRALGDAYFPIAFTTSEGDYTASTDFAKTEWKTFPLEKPYAGSVEFYLAKTGVPAFLFPLKNLPMANEVAWTGRELLYRGIGFMQMERQFGPVQLRKHFDAVIHVQRTTHSRSYMLR